MKALLLDGSLKDELHIFRSLLVEHLEEKGFEVESILLNQIKVAPCQGEFDCWLKTPGECKTDDDGRELAKKMVQKDLVIHLTPITFGGYSSELKKVMDRFISDLLPYFTKRVGETHHKYRYKKRSSIIVVGVLDTPDEEKESVFKELVSRNSLNMGAPIHEAIIYIKDIRNDDFIREFGNLLEKVEGMA